MPLVRCFAGIELDAESRSRCGDARARILADLPAWRDLRWVAATNLHLTLAFFGDVDEGRIPLLCDALGTAIEAREPFSLALSGLEAAPSPSRATLLWVRYLDRDGRAGDLSRAVEAAASVVGHVPEERGFTPHVTLARFRRRTRVPAHALHAISGASDLLFQSMSVQKVTLFSSRLAPAGPTYRSLGSWRLEGGVASRPT